MTMIEKVARALANNTRIRLGYTDSNYAEYNWSKFTSDAKVAIEAMREPTSDMVGKACGAIEINRTEVKTVYGTMIDAALKE